jgi:leucyl/phenylalanyl-tRNA--protein transferase
MKLQVARLDEDPASGFPPADQALADPNGLLAVGGDLSPPRLLDAYRRGIFPWFERGQPILWWSPDPRMVFRTEGFRLSRRFRRALRALDWTVRADTCFDAVVAACAAPRPGQRGTWITPGMRAAYGELHRLGHAHSVEVFAGGALAGGLYGVAAGRMFFAESMFSALSGGSKAALAALSVRLRGWDWPLIDAQLENPHLRSLGGEAMPREAFLVEVGRLVALEGRTGPWTEAFGTLPASAVAG